MGSRGASGKFSYTFQPWSLNEGSVTSKENYSDQRLTIT
jgi:hypothetical protein